MEIDAAEVDRLNVLATQAWQHRPRLFTLYGMLDGPDGTEFLGWGMYFPTLASTVFHNPNAAETHRADSPERIQQLYAGLGEVRLDWLDQSGEARN